LPHLKKFPQENRFFCALDGSSFFSTLKVGAVDDLLDEESECASYMTLAIALTSGGLLKAKRLINIGPATCHGKILDKKELVQFAQSFVKLWAVKNSCGPILNKMFSVTDLLILDSKRYVRLK
jgi:hypothetical protein